MPPQRRRDRTLLYLMLTLCLSTLPSAFTTTMTAAVVRAAGVKKAIKPMTRDEAAGVVKRYLRSFGVKSDGLNANNLGGAMVGVGSVYFEYHLKQKALECSALIYRFHDTPKPGVIEGFKAEEKAGTDTGGGTVVYEPENRGLYLSRAYTHILDDRAFRKDMDRLLKAGGVWGDAVMDRVASKVFHPDERKDAPR